MKIILLINSPLKYCPRAYRLFNKYKNKHQFNIIDKNNLSSNNSLLSKTINFTLLLSGMHQTYLDRLTSSIKSNHHMKADLVIVYDILLLDYAVKNLTYKKLAIDLREYYPAQFEQNIIWRLTFSRLYHYICKYKVCKSHSLTTVSNGIAKLYQKNYCIKPMVRYSFPRFHKLNPSAISSDCIQLVHHGVCNPNRGLDELISTMSLLGDKYRLTLYLINNNNHYYNKLNELALKLNNVQILPPLKFEDIIPTLNQYDIGILSYTSSETNIKHCMPNKFFEFIQARLAVITSPNKEVEEIIYKFKNGIVSSPSPSILSEAIKELCPKEIAQQKACSGIAARSLSN